MVIAVPASATPAIEAADVPPLGVPDRITLVVDDVAAVTAQLEAAAGTRFGPAVASRVAVHVGEEREARELSFLRSTSADNKLDVVQGSPATGPWAVDDITGTVHLTYSVDDRQRYEAILGATGFTRRASSEGFSLWEGIGGVTVNLSDPDALPEAGGSAGKQHTDLGPVGSLTLAPCDRGGVKNQLTEALGLSWKTPLPMALPWQFADGHVEVVPQLIHASQDKSPHLTIETPDPAKNCTSDLTPWHIVYFAADLFGAEERIRDAGMTFVGGSRWPWCTTRQPATCRSMW